MGADVMPETSCAAPRFRERSNGGIDFANRSTLDAWQVAWSHLQAGVQPDGLGALLPKGRSTTPRSIQTALLAGPARAALPQLMAATRALEISTALAAAIPLVGAGPGLTPSWDDLLVGFLCGLRATAGKDRGQKRFFTEFAMAVGKASALTSPVSRSYIEQTADGFGPTWIEDVLAAIGAGDCELTRQTTARALRMGHTSGTDMMLGVVLGSAAWQAGAQAAHALAVLSCPELHCATTPQGM
jgi:hypothetical protein